MEAGFSQNKKDANKFKSSNQRFCSYSLLISMKKLFPHILSKLTKTMQHFNNTHLIIDNKNKYIML